MPLGGDGGAVVDALPEPAGAMADSRQVGRRVDRVADDCIADEFVTVVAPGRGEASSCCGSGSLPAWMPPSGSASCAQIEGFWRISGYGLPENPSSLFTRARRSEILRR